MKRLPKMPFEFENCFIAGGSILSTVTKTDVADYDVYPKNKNGLESALYVLMEDHSSFICNISDRAITLKVNDVKDPKTGNRVIVQIMFFKWFETAKSIFDVFDFTVCMGAYDCDTQEYVFHEDFYGDIASKTLRFNHNTKFPLNSLMRVSKYKNKGYHIGKFEYTKIALAIAKKGLPNSWEELEREIGGVYGKEIKLQQGEDRLEYSYENAISVLSELEFDPDYYLKNEQDNDSYSDVSIEEIIQYFTDEEKEYTEVYNNKLCHFIENEFFLGNRVSKHLIEFAGTRNFKKRNPSKLFGYISLDETKVLDFKKTFSRYQTIDVYNNKQFYEKNFIKNKGLFLVSYNVDNISMCKSDFVRVHSNINIEKKVDNTTTALEDVFDVLNNFMHN
jgi:hypothetical protein